MAVIERVQAWSRALKSEVLTVWYISKHPNTPWHTRALALGLVAYAAALLIVQGRPIDIQRSTITVHVGKGGLFSVAGHEHWVEAPIASGLVNESEPAGAEFTVVSAKMQVKPDSKVDTKTQAEVQRSMREKVLESNKYPEIRFRSSRVKKQSESQWRVEGSLSLHGVTKPIIMTAARSGGAYTGRTTIRQTDFGIKPSPRRAEP